ncbi:galanin receptor type 1-like [Asterias rubens]|uniref:galanin receptor type 1-like n=1 Tax=Asterias rubens TaxID=7604 RepID=UPI0014559368|nr:galanin receptor type 1-like [Asterias rubens]XP_033631321.1 galanin receptor type 1-like [Asterias rubens]
MAINLTEILMDDYSNSTGSEGVVHGKEAFVTIFCVFCFFGIIGNGSLMFLVIRFPHLRTMPNILMINLTFGDLLYIVASLPDIVRFELGFVQTYESLAMCKFVKFLPGFAMGVCVYSMMALSVERYCAIVRGLEMRSVRTSRRVMGAMIFIWGMTFLVTSPVLLSSGYLYPSAPTICSDMWPGSPGAIAYAAIHITFLYIMPLLTMAFCYSSISYQLIQGARESTSNNSRSNTNYEARKRLAIAIIVMAAFFAIFWLPASVFSLYFQSNYEHIFNMNDSEIAVFHFFRRFSRVFAFTNSCFNPWILYFISTTHRRAIARCICFCCGPKNGDENGSYRMVRLRTNGRTVTTYHSYSSESGRGNRIVKPEDI